MWELIYEDKFQETAALLLGSIFVITLFLYFLKKINPSFKGGFASTQSWLLIAPLIFVSCGLVWPYPLYVLAFISIYGAKNFFQMTGMYHRTNFVWICYLGILVSTYCIIEDYRDLFKSMPVVVLFFGCLVPLLRNSYQRMVQYMALTLVNFCFIWAFLHLGFIMKMEQGMYIVIYIILLTEFFDTIYLGISKYLKNIRLVSNITPKRSLEGFILAGAVTMVLAWAMRHLLPVRNEYYWGLIGFICCLFGSTGDTVLAVVRRDLGIKVTDAFILGRGDFFSRLDRLVFVAPISYYALRGLAELPY
jgi:phosphatidate cytidylyltransferase